MSKIKETTIEKITYKGSQSISFREIYKLDEKRIKLEIKSDSYDQQCYANLKVVVAQSASNFVTPKGSPICSKILRGA